jgi:integrase
LAVASQGPESRPGRDGPQGLLQAVKGLRKGLPGVRETKKIRPVSAGAIKKVLKQVGPMVRAMILIQFHTGCRPSEVCWLKPKRIDRSGEVWVYRPGRHKTAHHGTKRRILIGPRAQKPSSPQPMPTTTSYSTARKSSGSSVGGFYTLQGVRPSLFAAINPWGEPLAESLQGKPVLAFLRGSPRRTASARSRCHAIPASSSRRAGWRRFAG